MGEKMARTTSTFFGGEGGILPKGGAVFCLEEHIFGRLLGTKGKTQDTGYNGEVQYNELKFSL